MEVYKAIVVVDGSLASLSLHKVMMAQLVFASSRGATLCAKASSGFKPTRCRHMNRIEDAVRL